MRTHCTPHTWPVETALELASHDLAVFPCHAVLPNSGGCTCGNDHCPAPGRHPLLPDGFDLATTDPDTIRLWWERWPRANVAICTGPTRFLVADECDAMRARSMPVG